MVRFGYSLSSEEHPPATLVANAARAEECGFDFLSMSDHYHPWVSAQGHSPFVWSMLGAVAARTAHIDVGVGVCCPIQRVHPAIIAQAAATTSLLFEGRFFLGVGSGEALNEHILGHRWPPPEIRLAMLEESVAVMRKLWSGETLDHHGDHYVVENAKLFDPPEQPIPVIVSGFGPKAVSLAAKVGDGYWGHSPEPKPVEQFREGGGRGPRYAQVNICWAEDLAKARETAHRMWPNTAVGGQLPQDLPTWTHFEAATANASEEQVTESIPCGPDVETVVESIEKYADAGYDHLHLHQIGPDQEGFFRFWDTQLGPALRSLNR